MMRELTGFEVQGAETGTKIHVMDEPGAGGANHSYGILWRNGDFPGSCRVEFQNGPVRERGVNGVTQEHLLAIVADRLACFQAGPFANDYNGLALNYVNMALETLKNRTRDRVARNVEGRSAA